MGLPEKALIERWRSRAQAGRDQNLANYRVFAAIDQAWDAGFRQTTQAFVGMIRDLRESSGEESALTAAQNWGLTHLIRRKLDPKTGKETGTPVLDLPVMYQVILSLPRSFTLMRVSRITTERLQVPLMKYEPALMTDDNRLKCELGTSRIETGNREFGYAEVFAEAVQASAMYGQQLQFICEEWYTENDVVDMEVDDGAGGTRTTFAPRVGKEGVRYVLPHPSRSYIDPDWPAWTLNHDSGVSYAGYWRVTTYRNIRNTPGYWNGGRISRATMFSDAKWSTYFQTVGNRQMAVPYSNNWFSPNDRERQIDSPMAFYSQSQDDQPVWVTEHFEKFNPRVDFEDPNYPDAEIWFRIVLASDDTPIYVTALVERPTNIWLYEPVGNRSIQTSLMMELMPYGDHGTNLLSQALVSAEQNLANLTIFDDDLLDPTKIKDIVENPNKKFYRKIQLMGFSGKKLLRSQKDPDALFKSFRFPQLDVSNHLTLLHELIGLMQRAVGMSDQEVGSSASHEQSAEEIRTIHTATGHRAEYVAAWVDFTFEAWKRQLWAYFTQYGSLEAVALLGGDNARMAMQPGSGFQVEDMGGGRVMVRAAPNSLRVEHFVAQRDGPNRIPWVSIGGQMLAFLNSIMASPLVKSVPPQQLADLVNEGLDSLQFPKSFRLRLPQVPENAIPGVLQEFIQQQLGELAKQVQGFIAKKIQEHTTSEHSLSE